MEVWRIKMTCESMGGGTRDEGGGRRKEEGVSGGVGGWLVVGWWLVGGWLVAGWWLVGGVVAWDFLYIKILR